MSWWSFVRDLILVLDNKIRVEFTDKEGYVHIFGPPIADFAPRVGNVVPLEVILTSGVFFSSLVRSVSLVVGGSNVSRNGPCSDWVA